MTDLFFTFSEALLFALISGVIGVFVGFSVMVILSGGARADSHMMKLLDEREANSETKN
jgi:hypothetical protein